jgi:hypothetical protein
MMCLWASHKKKNMKKKYFFHASLQSMKKGVGFISQRCGSGSGSAPKCHGSPTSASKPQSTYTQRVPQCICPRPTPLSCQPVYPSPRNLMGGGGHIRLRVRGWEGVLHLLIIIVPSPFAISFLSPEHGVRNRIWPFGCKQFYTGAQAITISQICRWMSGLFEGFNLIFYLLSFFYG